MSHNNSSHSSDDVNNREQLRNNRNENESTIIDYTSPFDSSVSDGDDMNSVSTEVSTDIDSTDDFYNENILSDDNEVNDIENEVNL